MTTNDHLRGSRESYERLADPGIYWTYTDGQPILEPVGPAAEPEQITPSDNLPAEAGRCEGAHVFRPQRSDEAEAHHVPRRVSQLEEYESRQREYFGGINWGAGFFGWIVAVGMSVLLTGLAGAAAAILGRTAPSLSAELRGDPRYTALVAAAVLVAVVMTAHFIGGYVAGRMSRFDGGRQGAAVWVTGLVLTGFVAAFALLFGGQDDPLAQLNLPTPPIPSGAMGMSGLMVAAVVMLGSLLTAIGGGRAGLRYHQKVDEFP